MYELHFLTKDYQQTGAEMQALKHYCYLNWSLSASGKPFLVSSVFVLLSTSYLTL